jgi:hypothetical protein
MLGSCLDGAAAHKLEAATAAWWVSDLDKVAPLVHPQSARQEVLLAMGASGKRSGPGAASAMLHAGKQMR